MPTTQPLSNEIIEAAIIGFETQKRNIDARLAELRQMLTGTYSGDAATTTSPAASSAGTGTGRRKMSAEGRRRIAEAQRKRWAAIHGEASAKSEPAGGKKKQKRKLSPEGRQRIIEATKKRWAAFRAANKTAK
jgi:hypothetical protein